jgi:hypothetical protein
MLVFRKFLRCWRGIFKIKVPHEDSKDASVKGLAFKIHELVEELKKLLVVQQAGLVVDAADGFEGGTLTMTTD